MVPTVDLHHLQLHHRDFYNKAPKPETKMEALRTVMLMLGCAMALVLLPGSEAVGRVSVGTSLDVALPTRRTRGHIYIKLASDMDDATASKAQDIVVKGINENEEGSDAAEQIKEELTDLDGSGWSVFVVDLGCKKFAASISYKEGTFLHAIMRSSGGWLRRIVLFK